MNEPHVSALFYTFHSEPDERAFEQAAPLATTVAGFAVQLAADHLVARPTAHFPSEATARAAIEPALRDWEASAYLRMRLRILFEYERARHR